MNFGPDYYCISKTNDENISDIASINILGGKRGQHFFHMRQDSQRSHQFAPLCITHVLGGKHLVQEKYRGDMPPSCC